MLVSGGGGGGGVGLDVFEMAGVAQEMPVQRVAAVALLVVQLHVAVLTVVALHMIVFVHGNHTDGLVRSLRGQNGLAAGGTLWSQDSVVVFDAVDPVLCVHGEGDSIQALIADDTAEAAGVVRLA